ncbi:MAG TPA: enoyl-CoA hydratase-related protein [Bacteroidota bacterium]|nr:enoyl-CoA hydratase-related protein [Bacteroidota bacterium]
MPYETLITGASDRVATITINRPEKLNAINARVKEEMADCVRALKADPEVDVVILTGAGDRAFVAGTDIGELRSLDAASGKQFSSGGQALFDQVEHLGKPVIAAVNGYALGGGCELALACHIRLASERAKFGQPEVNLGIIPGYGGTQRLARVVGPSRAMEMVLTGVQIDAAEALRAGLVSRVYPHAELLDRARQTALMIASMGQFAIRMALKAVASAQEAPLAEGQKLEASLFGLCCGTADFAEGTLAFMEKRKPRFTGS